MTNKWFDLNTIQDKICKAAAITIIKNKINSYDNIISLFEDTNGNISINDFIENLLVDFQGYQIDLTKYHIPILPNKILIISKDDLIQLKNLCILRMNIL